MWKIISEKEKEAFNKLVTHPLQSYEWGEFRKKTGIQVIRKGFFQNNTLTKTFQLTIHPIPRTKWNIGYLPKGTTPTKEMIEELRNVGKEHNCIFMQLEPNIGSDEKGTVESLGLIPAAHPLFTKFTFLLDLKESEQELLLHMSQKTRYNIRIAQKHHVIVKEEHTPDAFNAYLKLTKETTNRQGFFAHTQKYHELMWETLRTKGMSIKEQEKKNTLQAHLFVAYFESQPLTTWIVFTFHDTLYYPYGASSSEHRETMSSNLMMWEVIKFGKKMGLKTFDMWGSLGPNPDVKDPWYGFHRFKMGYGAKLVEFAGSYDLIINPVLYRGYKIMDKLRWMLMKLKK